MVQFLPLVLLSTTGKEFIIKIRNPEDVKYDQRGGNARLYKRSILDNQEETSS
jgi:hypothetical protein